jgi:hypothetical protein
VQTEPLTIKQTRTGYWVVQRGAVPLTGATTREGAEAERELLTRLRMRSARRLGEPGPPPAPRPAGARTGAQGGPGADGA